MKYRGVGTLPSSVAHWLEQQFEERGIDRVVYSRYISNLFQRNDEELTDIPVLAKGGELEGLVNEFWVKLKEADKDGNKCLKEKTNSEDIFNLELPLSAPDQSIKYYSAFPAVSKEHESFCLDTVWARNFNRHVGKKQEFEGSPKCSKRKDNKENVCGVMRSRMRSRSMVKQPGGNRHKMRSSAKSLDRKDDELIGCVKNEKKGRKCLNFVSNEVEGTAAKLSRTPGREKIDINEFDQDLPMDFQQLLQSPDDSSLYRHPKQNQPQPNFIQSGTNLTNSIWSERMEEDEMPTWDMNKWSDARSSILSSAWKLPFTYEKDVESTNLSLADEGSFFSFFGSSISNLKNTSLSEAFSNQLQDEKKTVVPKVLNKFQNENLLTSMRTHFRPIKYDGEAEPQGQGYIDGSTFLISTNLEQPNFKRSESGGLYLGSENKYYEFKRSDSAMSSADGCFVPKFKVYQSEKFCQTDDEDVQPSELEDNESSASNFFFPGDDQLAEDMVNSAEEEDQPAAIQVNGWVTTWPVSESGIWSNTQEKINPWIFDSGNAKLDNDIDGKNERYARLRNELTEEGEELLSDLSSIHLFLDPERMDDSNPIIQSQNCSPKMHIQPCSIKTGNISNEPFF
ncbi:uncharacterized protein LOC106666194 [Cimex lectularius]|uniref:Uncharacterized protein n=1 Tax=Cimex lectularius TaxID=79782 RepID=A0A8I6TE56_CIMLE|nr:uncharacterized protein LOC106666194 [Cimex lectularius]